MTLFDQSSRWRATHRRQITATLALGAAAVVIMAVNREWWDGLIVVLQATNALVCFALACVLPLLGVSITLLYMVAGARFGSAGGIAFMAAASVVHLAGTHLLARSILRAPFDRFLQRRGYRLPEVAREHPATFSLLAALVPGPPYFVRNYLLALFRVPLRVYLAVCWPVYVVRSSVAIILGDWGQDLSASRVAILAGILALNSGLSALLVRYLYHHRGIRTAPSPLPSATEGRS